ncbi:MAG: lytic transglycosylase domain-containing protein, partial [Candidatus Paceibacterota bacterium]
SGFKKDKVSPVGAVGYMQLMPSSALEAGIKVSDKIGRKYYWGKIVKKNEKGEEETENYLNRSLFDSKKDERLVPEKNIEAGSRLLKKYKKRFLLDSLARVAYNEGPGKLAKRISAAFPQIVVGGKYGTFVDKELYKSLVENGTINFADLYNFADKQIADEQDVDKQKELQKYKEALDYALNVEVFYRRIAEIEAGRGETMKIAKAEDGEKEYGMD